jgi:hypothetical protein
VALLRQAAYAIAVSVAATMSAAAADWPLEPVTYPATYPLFSPRPIAQWESEIGGRYWYSVGRTEKNLFGFPGGPPIFLSRLTYTNLQAHSGEAFGRLEHLSGFFIKGFAGGGGITGGNLQDEDFPPIPGGYSSTNSDQRDGRLAYATVDLGWTWRSEGIKLGFFGGYFYNFERVNAFGCTQAAANPFICVPPIPSSVLAITQDTSWNAVRVGFNGEWRFGGGGARVWIWHGYPLLGSARTTRIGCARSTRQRKAPVFPMCKSRHCSVTSLPTAFQWLSAGDIGELTVRLGSQQLKDCRRRSH